MTLPPVSAIQAGAFPRCVFSADKRALGRDCLRALPREQAALVLASTGAILTSAVWQYNLWFCRRAAARNARQGAGIAARRGATLGATRSAKARWPTGQPPTMRQMLFSHPPPCPSTAPAHRTTEASAPAARASGRTPPQGGHGGLGCSSSTGHRPVSNPLH